MEHYRDSKPVRRPVPASAPPEVPHENPMEDPEIEIIGVFPAKSSIKKMIQDSFKQTYEQDNSDDVIIIEPAHTNVPSKKSQPIPKIKLRKLSTGEDVWNFWSNKYTFSCDSINLFSNSYNQISVPLPNSQRRAR